MGAGLASGQHLRKYALPPVEVVQRFVRYDPESGLVEVYRERHGRWSAPAPRAHRYVVFIICDGERRYSVMAHRVAWVLMTGEWPRGFVDHLDGNTRNNCWSNLRDVSPSGNQISRYQRARGEAPQPTAAVADALSAWRHGQGVAQKRSWRKRAALAGRNVPVEWARERFSYDPLTGRIGRRQTGEAASCHVVAGYEVWAFTRDGFHCQVKGHQIAFACMTGQWPLGVVDHVNGDRQDNRWSNLRDVSHRSNMLNSSLVKGASHIAPVVKRGERFWRVHMQHAGRRFVTSRMCFGHAVALRAAMLARRCDGTDVGPVPAARAALARIDAHKAALSALPLFAVAGRP